MKYLYLTNSDSKVMVDDEDYDKVEGYPWCIQRFKTKRYIFGLF